MSPEHRAVLFQEFFRNTYPLQFQQDSLHGGNCGDIAGSCTAKGRTVLGDRHPQID
jgi:hypothetical protein